MHSLTKSPQPNGEITPSTHDHIRKLTILRAFLGARLNQCPGNAAVSDLYRKVCDKLIAIQTRAEASR